MGRQSIGPNVKDMAFVQRPVLTISTPCLHYSLKTLTSVKGTWDSIPYRSTVAFTMTRIIGMICLLRKLQSVLHETYG